MSNILTGFNMQGNDPIDNRIVSPSKFETLEEYLQRVPIQKRYYGLSFYALDENNELRHYTFQTSLIEPTIDDDEEEIERLDKELQEHVNNKEIHKTSEEIRSEIVDADIPDTIARVQWTLDQIKNAVDTVMNDIVDGASDEYNTLKKIQDKIVELRTEMESQLYGDDGGDVLKTLEQALKFLNQYKDFIVDIPDNYVNKQDIVDNLNTDDPTKVLSARQGKVLSETLTNYFDSAMASIRAETNRATNAENRIEAKLDSEIDRSTAEDIRIQSELDAEEARAQSEEKRIEDKLDAEIERSTTKDTELGNQIIAETDRAEGEESRIEAKLDNEITRSTNKDTEHDNKLQALEGQTHEQNTDLGTTNSTFQLKYNTGNKIKHESDAISVRNAADTDYVNFIAKNATFKGDLLVEGQSFVTEAETVEIKDNLLLLNKGEVGAGVTKGIAGLEIDRGTEPNYFIIFDESDNRFKAGVEGDLWNLALRESDDNMLDGYFISWNSKDKILSTTNIVNESTPLLFGRTDYKQYSGNRTDPDGNYSSYAFISEAEGNHLYNFSESSNWNIDTDKINFRFWKPLLGTTFKRASDNSEVLYHADIVNNLTSGGTNKVLSAEQGKLLQNSITSIQGSYLPLSGGTMKNSIRFPAESGIIGNADGTSDTYILRSFNNRLDIGSAALSTRIISNASDLLHHRLDTSYKIWDAYNLTSPLNYAAGTAAAPNQAYLRNIGVNGTQWSFLSTINTATTSIYAPTTTGTSGQVLTSTGGIPTWSNISSIGDSRYVLKSGDTMTGALENSSYIKSLYWRTGQPEQGWSSDKTPNDYASMSLYLEDDYNGGSGISSYGTVLTMSGRSGYWINQLRISGGASELSIRSCTYNATPANRAWTAWVTLPNKDYISSNYLKLTGGTLTGALTISLSSVAPIILNNTNASATEISQTLRIGGKSKGYFGYTTSTGVFMQNATSSIICVKDNGAYYGTSANTLTKLLTSADLSSYATQSWCNSKFAPLDRFNSSTGYTTIKITGQEFNFNSTSSEVYMNYRTPAGATALTKITWRAGGGADSTALCEGRWGNLYMNNALVATQSWVNSQGFLKSVSGYLPLTGGTMSGSITIPGGSGTLVITARETSNYVRGISFTKGSTVNSAVFGYHSTGGSDSSGALILVPYPTSANPWVKTVGLYIAKNELLLDGKQIATTDQIPSIPSISISNSGSGNAVTAITASGHTLTVTKGATYLTSSSLSGYATQSWVTSQGYLTSSSLSGYATQTWANGRFLPLSGGKLTGDLSFQEASGIILRPSNDSYISGIFADTQGNECVAVWAKNTVTRLRWHAGIDMSDGTANLMMGITPDFEITKASGTAIGKIAGNEILHSNNYTSYTVTKTGGGASGTWGINVSGNAATATTATKLGSSTVGGTAKPIYLSSGTATACSATVGSSTVPVYMSSGTITQCSTTLGVSITGNAATATTASNSNNLGGVAAASYVKSTSTTKVQDIQVVTTAGSTTGVLYVVLES